MKISMIVAADENNLIGKDGGLPWHLPEDLRHFRQKTAGAPVIMGRKTFESLPRALVGREVIVLQSYEPTVAYGGIPEAIWSAEEYTDANPLRGTEPEAFVAGGASVYRQFLDLELIDTVYLTRIHHAFDPGQHPTYLPELANLQGWKVRCSARYPEADGLPAYSFITLDKP